MIDYGRLYEVRSEKLFTSEGMPDEDGLLSQRIFGPTSRYKCLCGSYASKVLYDSERCPKCNVLCADINLRDTSFAKITLTYPFYKYSGKQSLLKLTGKRYEFIFNPILRDMASSMGLYLTLNTYKDLLKLEETFTPNDQSDMSIITIPIPVVGTYSLYIALQVAGRLHSNLAKKYLKNFQFVIPVIPPNSRPSTSISTANGRSKSKYIHELDAMYINILHKRNFLTKQSSLLVDIDAMVDDVEAAIFNDSPVLIDDMVLYELEQSKIQYYVNKLYETVQTTLSGKEGLIRRDFLGKIIDFSARAVISPNPALLAYEIKIPVWLFIKLWFVEYLWYLAEIEGIEINNIKEIMRNADGIKKETNSIGDFVAYFFKNSTRQKRLIFINRQPTLWRYGMPAVDVIGVSSGNTIETSPIFLDPLNGDYDGDTLALYRAHDYIAILEMEENAFVLNTIKYDHNSSYLHTIKDETFFYLKIFTDTADSSKIIEGEFTLSDIGVDEHNIKMYDHIANIEGEMINVGLALVNIAARFNRIAIKPGISRQELSRTIYRDCENNEQYFTRLNALSNFLNCGGLLIGDQAITLPVIECNNIVNLAKTHDMLDRLPNHPVIGYIAYRAIIAKIMKQIPTDSQMHKFRKTKFGEIQFSRSLVCTGYVSDHNNITSGQMIRNSTFGGLTEDEFFRTSYGARKGITDKDKVVPDSGYLERSMVMNFSPVEICEDDCGTEYGFPIKIVDITHAKSLIGRSYTSTGSNVWVKLDPDQAKDLVGQEIMVRSPITCITENHKICKKCFGDDKTAGPYVGLITGQYLAERMTQLAMRTFHTSGSATYNFSDDLYDFMTNHLIDIKQHHGYFSLRLDKNIPDGLLIEMRAITHKTYIADKSSPDTLAFEELNECENDDVSTVLNAVKDQMKVAMGVSSDGMQNTYSVLIRHMLSLGFIKSVFIEIALCNTFINTNDETFRAGLRKAQLDGDDIAPPYKRLNIKNIHKYTSPLLSLLYEPNARSIRSINNVEYLNTNIEPEKMTIFERIWMGTL